MKETDNSIHFAEEREPQSISTGGKWKVLVVDDDEQVHQTTRLVLDDFIYDGKGLKLLSAYSAEEAKIYIDRNPDIAVILLDVVMEEYDSGLKLVKYIREEAGNRLVRIILKTGQPGYAPERKVILEYDINDYREKTELTEDRFITAVVAALRAYKDMTAVEAGRKGLESIIRSCGDLYGLQSVNTLASAVLTQLVSILPSESGAFFCKTSTMRNDENLYIMAASGEFCTLLGKNARDAAPKDIYIKVQAAFRAKESIYCSSYSAVYFKNRTGSEGMVYVSCSRELNGFEKDLMLNFCENYTAAFDNISINNELIGSLTEAVIITDASNRIVFCNDMLQKYFPGYHDNKDDLARFAAYLRKSAACEGHTGNVLDEIENCSGGEFEGEIDTLGIKRKCYDIHIKPVCDTGGRNLGRVISFRDVTEYKEMLNRLNEQNIQLSAMNEQVRKYAAAIEELNSVQSREKKRAVADICDSMASIFMILLRLTQGDGMPGACGFSLLRPELASVLKTGSGIFREAAAAQVLKPQKMKTVIESLEGLEREYKSIMERNRKAVSVLESNEIEILRMIARGKSNREIASALSFEEGTIKNKIGEIIRKLTMSSETEKRCMLVSFVYEKGLADESNFADKA